MKHIKSYNESNETSFTKEDLEDIFAHSFDEANDHNIIEVYFNPKDLEQWSDNIYEYEGGKHYPGYQIIFHHDFYDQSTLEDFEKYSNLISEIRSDIERFKGMYNISDIFFAIMKRGHEFDSILRLVIRP